MPILYVSTLLKVNDEGLYGRARCTLFLSPQLLVFTCPVRTMGLGYPCRSPSGHKSLRLFNLTLVVALAGRSSSSSSCGGGGGGGSSSSSISISSSDN